MLKTHKPFINTIPDDSIVFSIVEQNTPLFTKLVMENYINFYAFNNYFDDKVLFRFENFLNYQDLNCFTELFIPFDYLKKFSQFPNSLIQLIDNEYYLLLANDMYYISFYDQFKVEHLNHKMMIYGYDESKKLFYCKDYKGTDFQEYVASFEEVLNSIKNYLPCLSRESLGLRGFKINKQSLKVDYAKVYMQLLKCKYSISTKTVAYGIAGIKLFINDAKSDTNTNHLLHRWEETSNLLRESLKLMTYRLTYLNNTFPSLHVIEHCNSYSQLKETVDKMFFISTKLLIKGSLPQDKKLTLEDLAYKSMEAYDNLLQGLIEVVSTICYSESV